MKYKSPYGGIFVLGVKQEWPEKVKKPPKMRYRFELSIDYADKEIIEELEKHPNKSEYVRQLIRNDLRGR